MEKLLTLIIPAYNAESTLRTCLASLEYEWLDAIVVDDGSTDGTKAIAEAAAARHPDIFRVITKPNGGHGSALNLGFKTALGKYVGVLDADDYALDALGGMPEFLHLDADIIINDFVRENIGSGKSKRIKLDGNVPRECTLDILKERVTIHSFVIKRQLLQFALTEGCYYDDVQFTLYSFERAVTFYYSALAYYVYTIGRPGQSVSPENIFKKRNDYVTVLKNIVTWYTSSDKCNDGYIFGCLTSAVVTNYNRYTSFINRDESVRAEIIQFDEWLLAACPRLYKAAGDASLTGYINRLRGRGFTKTKLYGKAFDCIKKIKGY